MRAGLTVLTGLILGCGVTRSAHRPLTESGAEAPRPRTVPESTTVPIAEACPVADGPRPTRAGMLDAPLSSGVEAAVLGGGTATLGRADGWIEIWSTADLALETRWRGSERPIAALAVRTDGSVLAASNEAVARLWTVKPLALVRRFELDCASIGAAAASSGTSVVALGCDDGTVGVWRDVAARPRKLHVSSGVVALAVSGDGRWVAAGEASGDVTVFGGAAQRTVRVADSRIEALAFTRGTRLSAAARDGTVAWVDARTGRERRRIPGCAWTTSSVRLEATGQSHPIPCESAAPSQHPSEYDAIAFGPGGKEVIFAGGQVIDVRDPDELLASGAVASTWVGAGVYTRVATDPDGRRALACRSHGVCEVFDLERREFGAQFGGIRTDVIHDIAVDPSARRLMLVSQSGVSLWTLPCAGATARADFGLRGVSVGISEGRFLVSSYATTLPDSEIAPALAIFDRSGRSRSMRVESPVPFLLGAAGRAARFAFASSVERIDLGDAGTGRTTSVIENWCSDARCGDGLGQVRDLQLSNDGRLLAAASAGRSPDDFHCLPGPECGARGFTLAAWALSEPGGRAGARERARLLWTRYGLPVNAVAVSPGAEFVAAGGADEMVTVYDAASGRVRHRLPQQGVVRAAAFSSDGTRVLTGDDDGVVRIWNLTALPEVHELRVHDQSVTRIRALPNGLALSSSIDGTVAVIRVRDASVLGKLVLLDARRWFVQSADGSVEVSDGARDVFEFRPSGIEGRHLPGREHVSEFSVPGLLRRLVGAR